MLFKKDFFSNAEKHFLKEAIQQAEEKTSGEIRIYLEPHCGDDVVAHATQVFHHLKMNDSPHRNSVLFYLAYKSRKFAIIGDEGVHQKVGNEFWHEVRKTMEDFFKQKQFALGLEKGINMTGEKLKQFFPHEAGNSHSSTNDITFR